MSEAYPDTPGARRDGTSRDAAASMKWQAATIRDLVLAEVECSLFGLTADECATRLAMSVLTVRPRFSELVKLGKLVDTGSRRANASQRRAIVWKAVS